MTLCLYMSFHVDTNFNVFQIDMLSNSWHNNETSVPRKENQCFPLAMKTNITVQKQVQTNLFNFGDSTN